MHRVRFNETFFTRFSRTYEHRTVFENGPLERTRCLTNRCVACTFCRIFEIFFIFEKLSERISFYATQIRTVFLSYSVKHIVVQLQLFFLLKKDLYEYLPNCFHVQFFNSLTNWTMFRMVFERNMIRRF